MMYTSDLSSCVDDVFQTTEQLELAKVMTEEVDNEMIKSQWITTFHLEVCFTRLGQLHCF